MPTNVSSTRRIDVDTHYMPRFKRSDLLDLLPRAMSGEALDMLNRDAERLADPQGIRAERRGEAAREEGGDPRRDPDARAEAMKEFGFETQVLIPDGPFGNQHGAGPYSVSPQLEVRLAMCRLFNNVSSETQKKFPDQFIGTAIVPFDNVAAASAEARRAAVELGLRVIVIPFNWVGKNFDEFELYPFWETINDLKMTVACHGITQPCGMNFDHLPRYPAAFAERMRRLHLGTYMGFGMEYTMACGALTLGGVFDEFQNLRFFFYEAGASWLVNAMYACDRSFLIEPQCSRTENLPSELIKERCLTAIEPMENIPELVKIVGPDNFFFGTDFPHPEFQVFHGANRVVTEHAAGGAAIEEAPIREEVKAKILGGNAARILNR